MTHRILQNPSDLSLEGFGGMFDYDLLLMTYWTRQKCESWSFAFKYITRNKYLEIILGKGLDVVVVVIFAHEKAHISLLPQSLPL
jgi:hypothetical protein